jgi:RNA polymerase sigma-70 factor (ECF subfamily)
VTNSLLMESALNAHLSDEQVVARVLSGDVPLFEILMRRYNQRLYRILRAIVRDDSQAEELLQESYVRAFQHLGQFEGRSTFAGWLIRIAVNEGLAYLRDQKRYAEPEGGANEGDRMDVLESSSPNPEQQAGSSEIRRLLELSIEELPQSYRTVFLLRDVEEMSTFETAEALEITEENVKIRLHRARSILRSKLLSHVTSSTKQVFEFGAGRCDRIVQSVFSRILPQNQSD